MGLLIKGTNQKEIKIDGTDIVIGSIYLRVAFTASVDGKTCEVALYSFASKEMFLNNKPIFTNVPTANLYVVIDKEKDQTQSIADVLLNLSEYYTNELGYEVEIIS